MTAAPVGEAVALDHEGHHDDQEGEPLLEADLGQPRAAGLDVEDLRLEHADADAGQTGNSDRPEAAEEGGPEGGHDQQAGARRVEARQRSGGDDREARRHRGQDPVGQADGRRRQAEDQGPPFVLGRRPGREAEAGEAVDQPEDADDPQRQGRQHVPVSRHLDPERVDQPTRQRAFQLQRGRGRTLEAKVDDPDQVHHQPEAGHDPGQGRGLSQRAEDQQEAGRPHRRPEQHDDDQRAGDRRAVQEGHPLG